MIQHFEQFIQLFEQEINNTAKKQLVLDAKSEIISLIVATVVEFMADGFVHPLENAGNTLLQPKFAFWNIISEELRSETLAFAKEGVALTNDQDRACVWILLELNNKTIATAGHSMASNQRIMQYYKNESAFKLLQTSMLALLTRLDALSYSIEAQCIQSFKKHCANHCSHIHKSYISTKLEFPNLNSEESDGDSNKEQAKTNISTSTRGHATNDSNLNILTGNESRALPDVNKSPDTQPRQLTDTSFSLTKHFPNDEASSQELTLQNRTSNRYATVAHADLPLDKKAADFVQKAQRLSLRKESQELKFEKKVSAVKVKPSERLYIEKFKMEEELYAYRAEPPDSNNPDVLPCTLAIN